MLRTFSRLILVVCLQPVLLSACAAPDNAAQTSTIVPATNTADSTAAPKVDYAAIAAKLVEQCAGIKEGDIVQVTGGIKDAELLEDIAVEVRKRGAFPLLTFSSDRLVRKMWVEVPERYDAQTSELGLKLAELVTARITIPSGENLALLADIPAERLAERTRVRAKASETITELNRKRAIPTVVVGGNNLFPTADNAKTFGFTQVELAGIFWAGVSTDYERLQADGEKYQRILAAAKTIHLSHPNGTDFTVGIANRRVYVSDGVVSAEDRERGFPATTVYLPAGEVFVTPVSGTAEGRIVVDRDFYEGMEIERLTFEFKAGKLTSMTAGSDISRLKANYDASPAGKELFGMIDLGINTSLKLGPTARRGDYAPAGMVSIGIGTNLTYGGDNKTSFNYESNLVGATLEIDGKVLVEKGVLNP
jgi:aminopeptidase